MSEVTPEQFLHELSQYLGTVHFLEIGAMDGSSFDLLHNFILEYRWQGLLVEPLPDLFEELVAKYADCDWLKFANVAIAEKVEKRSMFRIPLDVIQREDLPDWTRGISSLYDDRNAIGGYNGLTQRKLLDRRIFERIKDHVVEEVVSCVTLNDLIEKNDIQRVDVLQIDTEGADYQVLKQFDFNKFNPFFVKVEVGNLHLKEYEEVKLILLKNGYDFSEIEADIIAWKSPVDLERS